ncbi:MAG: hypothetical protein C4K49_11845 [Candidatus Thorarchaeota archaeon]|nr:MAG: hypothetical protein C4K49_11845 [Candidatus Thorarchaeota archaeon]
MQCIKLGVIRRKQQRQLIADSSIGSCRNAFVARTGQTISQRFGDGVFMEKLIEPLSELRANGRSEVGSKAANLGELINRGFKVPRGFVVTTRAHEELMANQRLRSGIRDSLSEIDYENPEDIEACSKKIRTLIEGTDLSHTLAGDIRTAYESLGPTPVAIRSSATAEDLPDASFAGQYDTFLHVQGADEVLKYIRECYSSLWSSRAIAYRHKNGIPHEKVRLAVIVQSMVQPRTAGVLFTLNPTSQSRSEMVIESNFGLGESVVSGEVAPDRYIVARRNVKGTETFDVSSREIGAKSVVVEAGPPSGADRLRYVKPSAETSKQSSLTDSEVTQLAEVGSSIERLFGLPQDIEWAIDKNGEVTILQSRPVTARTRRPQGNDDGIVWSRGYSDDYWNDNVSPLFYDLLGDQLTYIVNVELNSIMGYARMDPRLLKLFRAHVYFNLDVLRNKVQNEIPPFLRSDDVLNYFPEGSGPFGKETMRKFPFKLKNRLLAEIRVTLFDPNGSMTKTSSEYKRWTKEVFEPYCSDFDSRLDGLEKKGSPKELMELADELDKTMMSHFRLVRYGIPVHNIGMNLMANYLLAKFLGEKAARVCFPILISGLEHKTSETNERISQLATLVASDPRLKKTVIETRSADALAAVRLQRTSESQAFLAEFDRFLKDFGVRGFTREPYYERWGEAPGRVIDVLKSLVSGKDMKDLSLLKADTLRLRNTVEKRVEKAMKHQRNGGLKWTLFSTILSFCRTYIVFREDQRFNLDRWITRNRRAYLAIGDRLTAMGFIKEPKQVFFLHRKEVKKILSGTMGEDEERAVSRLSESRFKEFRDNEDTVPPKFMTGDREYNDPLPTCDSTSTLHGMAASQGRVTGRVRVLYSIDEIPQVKSDEILVVPRTDPGWTPVFSTIGGLITETGGILSHGAVVSREYGIPAVTNIRDACQNLKTGQIVTIDGSEGLVILH